MILNGAAIRASSITFLTLFTKGFEQAKPTYPELVTEVPSTGDSNVYDFVLGIPAVREWIGERQIQNLKVWDYTLRNKTWEDSVGIPREAYEDDSLGLFKPQFAMLGNQMSLHPDVLLAELLANAFTVGLCYDGKAFIATNHPLKTGTLSNKVSGALSTTTFNEAIQRLREMKDYSGNPIDVMGMGGELVLVVGPALESTARGILLAQQGASGASNTDYNRAKLKVFSRITNSSWFLMVAGGPLNPFIFQMRRKPVLVVKDMPDDDALFYDNQVVAGADGRWNMGYLLYQLIVGSTGS